MTRVTRVPVLASAIAGRRAGPGSTLGRVADLGFWHSVRPLALGLAAGLATVALTGSTATATAAGGGAEPGTGTAARQVRVMPPVTQANPCACESQVGAYLAGKPAPVAPGDRTTVTLTAWGKGSGKVGGSVMAHEVPKGWQVTPPSRSYTVDGSAAPAASAKLSFDVIAPAAAKPGTYQLVFRTVPFSGTESPELRVSLTVR
jgi:NPCBM-associated, NEW3 domain of alpha-galactosidase